MTDSIERHKRYPLIDPRLIAELEKDFPDRVPELSDTDRQIGAKIGNIEVVRFLKTILKEQNEVE